MIRTKKLSVSTTGADGSATGSGTTDLISGEILAIHVDYVTQPGTTDVTIATAGTPVQPILTLTSANTDGWFYPRAAAHSVAGAALTFDATEPVTTLIPVSDYVTVAVAQGDDPGSVNVTVLYRE